MNRPVSAILPVRNRERTVLASITSVLEQTIPVDELIVIDDGSSEHTPMIVREVNDDRIRIFTTKGCGSAAARNVGLEAARHDLIAFQDSDDLWHPEKLAHQLGALERARSRGINAAVAGCGHLPISESWPLRFGEARHYLMSALSILSGCGSGSGTPKLLVDFTIAPPTLFDVKMPALQDRDFVYSILRTGVNMVTIDLPLVRVSRGLGDHVAAPLTASLAYSRMCEKWQDDLLDFPVLQSWYHYRSAREYLRAGNRRRAIDEARMLPARWRWRTSAELFLGLVASGRGLAIAARIGADRAFDDRCSADMIPVEI